MPVERVIDESCLEAGDGEGDEDETEDTAMSKDIPDIRIGDSIAYKLRSDQRPTNPLRIYHGVVTGMIYSNSAMLVTLLDPEYDGLSEMVLYSQVVEVRRPEPEGGQS